MNSTLRFACRNTAYQIYPLNIDHEGFKGHFKFLRTENPAHC